jgi:hypothetical protein
MWSVFLRSIGTQATIVLQLDDRVHQFLTGEHLYADYSSSKTENALKGGARNDIEG